jgi:hypothetical protein
MRTKILPTCALVAAMLAAAQAQSPHTAESNPKIQVNFLNPCRPPAADIAEIGRALAVAKDAPQFVTDFEIARGITTVTEAESRAIGAKSRSGPSSWVRIRHEFPEKARLSDAQYSVSSEAGTAGETLALHVRDSKEVLQIVISNSVTGSAQQLLQHSTPPDRIRIERFGQASLVLARCSGMDQSSFQPTFNAANEILDRYRLAMGAGAVVPAELARLPGSRAAEQTSGGKVSQAAGAKH